MIEWGKNMSTYYKTLNDTMYMSTVAQTWPMHNALTQCIHNANRFMLQQSLQYVYLANGISFFDRSNKAEYRNKKNCNY